MDSALPEGAEAAGGDGIFEEAEVFLAHARGSAFRVFLNFLFYFSVYAIIGDKGLLEKNAKDVKGRD